MIQLWHILFFGDPASTVGTSTIILNATIKYVWSIEIFGKVLLQEELLE